MDTRMNILKILFLSLLFVLSFPSFAATDVGETVTKRGAVNDDYYAAGGTVDIDADVSGDLVVVGGDLYVGHRIQADIMAFGGTVNLRGEVLDDVRTAGGDLTIDANIGDDLVAAGGEIRITSGTSIGGDAWLAGGDVLFAGTADKDLVVGAGNIQIAGTIHGNVTLEGGEIKILNSAVIDGNLYYKSPKEADIAPDAKITGNITYEKADWERPHRGSGIFFAVTMLVASIVLYLLFPGFTIAAVDRISADPWKSLGVGFVLLVVTPIVAILLISIVLGVWVGLSIFALYFLSLLVGFLVGCFFLGDWGARRLQKDVSTTGRRIASVAIVIILLGILQLIPVISGLLIFFLLLLGLGAMLLQIRSSYGHAST